LGCVLEVSIPLLEGGLSYRGFITNPAHLFVTDLSAQVTKNVIDSARIKVVETKLAEPSDREYTVYDVSLLGEQDSGGVFRATVHSPPEDPQQFFGLVDQAQFVYKDLRDPNPIIGGGVVIVVVGIAAVLCAFNQIVGRIANRKCKKVEVTYGLGFNFAQGVLPGDARIGCQVKCLE